MKVPLPGEEERVEDDVDQRENPPRRKKIDVAEMVREADKEIKKSRGINFRKSSLEQM